MGGFMSKIQYIATVEFEFRSKVERLFNSELEAYKWAFQISEEREVVSTKIIPFKKISLETLGALYRPEIRDNRN
jgi:hypothetical protein